MMKAVESLDLVSYKGPFILKYRDDIAEELICEAIVTSERSDGSRVVYSNTAGPYPIKQFCFIEEDEPIIAGQSFRMKVSPDGEYRTTNIVKQILIRD